MNTMDTTIRNIDPAAYRAIKARAALSGQTIGQVINDAIRAYLSAPHWPQTGSIADLIPEPYPDDCDRLSEEIDAVAYGTP